MRGERLFFGVSVLLYNSYVLMYDRETESLWPQIARRAVSGPLRGVTLDLVPLVHTTWDRWRSEDPRGLVLSRETGHDRDYDRDPYLQYAADPGVMFSVRHRDPRLPERALVLGIEHAGAAVAFPPETLEERPRPVRSRVGSGDVFVYWFAWSAFHPRTQVWDADSVGERAAGDEPAGA